MGVAGGAIEPDDLLEKELARVLSKPPEHFAKRNQEKVDSGLDIPDANEDGWLVIELPRR